MARTVFVLGAGASVHTGAPLMGGFMAKVRDLRDSGDLPQEKQKAFDLVWDAFIALKPVHANISMDYQGNIENLFATFEMAKLTGQLGSFPREAIDQLPEAMRRVIASTIEYSVDYRIADDGLWLAHRTYTKLAKILRAALEGGKPSVAVLTFNYDIGLDYALALQGVPFSYCLDAGSGQEGVPLLKLHGSLNWVKCADPPGILTLPMTPRRSTALVGKGPWNWHVSDEVVTSSGCRGIEAAPFIVPPTWNKTQYHAQIDHVWARGVRELAEATKLFIIGYSFPSTDEFFHHLLALGLSRGGVMDGVWIVNPDGDVLRRFEGMLAGSLKKVLKFMSGEFEAHLDGVSHLLKV